MTVRWPIATDSWLDPRLEIRDSDLQGRGTFATAPIAAGEVVTVWAHRVLSASQVAAAPEGTVLARADGQWVWQPLDDHAAPDYLLNHACDANLGMADEVSLVARRAIAASEELTIDYAVLELDPEWVSTFMCRCQALVCRGTITGRDWERPDLQTRYANFFHPALAARIEQRAVSGLHSKPEESASARPLPNER